MNILLDTHILLWTLSNDPKLSDTAKLLIEDPDNEIYYSVISPWEVEIKHLNHPDRMTADSSVVIRYCRISGFHILPIRPEHISRLGSLVRKEHTPEHRDPFDRMMIAQAAGDGMIFLTHDERISEYTEPCILKV